jgi:hypothetical protein
MRKYGTNADGHMERDNIMRLLRELNGGVEPDATDVDNVMAQAHAMPFSSGISVPELIKVLSLWCSRNNIFGESFAPLVDAVCGGVNCGWRIPARDRCCPGTGDGMVAPASGCGAKSATCAIS